MALHRSDPELSPAQARSSIAAAILSRDRAAVARLEAARRIARPLWVRYDQMDRIVWLDEGSSVLRAIAVDDDGVHLRLTARDHRERTVLTCSLRLVERSAEVDPATATVMWEAWSVLREREGSGWPQTREVGDDS